MKGRRGREKPPCYYEVRVNPEADPRYQVIARLVEPVVGVNPPVFYFLLTPGEREVELKMIRHTSLGKFAFREYQYKDFTYKEKAKISNKLSQCDRGQASVLE